MTSAATKWLRPGAVPRCVRHAHLQRSQSRRYATRNIPELVCIESAAFYKDFPVADSAENAPVLRDVNFRLAAPGKDTSHAGSSERWAVVSSTSLGASTFLQVLADRYITVPPNARRYPFLAAQGRPTSQAINYVGFDAQRGSSIGGSDVRGAYLSARYESRREVTDFTLHQYLTGQTDLNPKEYHLTPEEQQLLETTATQLKLKSLLNMPVSNLSNGQTRRARIARSLMLRPDLLLLDGPFMGLDPMSRRTISNVLQSLCDTEQLRLIPSFRVGEEIPDWITHLVLLDSHVKIRAQGRKNDLTASLKDLSTQMTIKKQSKLTSDGFQRVPTRKRASSPDQESQSPAAPPEILIEMRGVKVSYGDRTVLGDWTQTVDGESKSGLWWSLSRGQRCAVFGPNGSGKTTLFSLITSDHPQSYSLPIQFFGRTRLPKVGSPGISLFDIQKRIGHSSPEIHAFFPRHLTVRRVLESAWAEAPLARPTLTSAADRVVDAYLRWWCRELHPSRTQPNAIEDFLASFYPSATVGPNQSTYDLLLLDDADLEWADNTTFGELSFSNQRLLLFLRAMVAEPDIVILDEALSGVDEGVRNKALLFLSWGEGHTLHPVKDKLKKTTQFLLDRVFARGLTDRQALVVISHAEHDVPGCVRDWICLPEPGDGRPPRMGKLDRPLDAAAWRKIWGQR